MKVNARHMKGVAETLMFTLYMRYRESRRPDAKISDKRYAELVHTLDFDFSMFEDVSEGYQLSIACRTIIFDTLTRDFLQRHPEAVVVSLGSGLDFRFERLDNGNVTWFDLDLPEVISLRKRFGEVNARCIPIASSVPELSWISRIPSNRPLLFVAEGLFMYFTPAQVYEVFSGLARYFRGAEIVLDVQSNWYNNAMKNTAPDSFMKKIAFLWQWGMDDWAELESFDPGIQLIEEYYQRECFGDRMPDDLKEALEGDVYTEFEQDIISKISRIGHLRIKDASPQEKQ